MTELRAFNNPEFGTIRTIEENGKTLFCGIDVAKALGYRNTCDTLGRRCKGVVKRDAPTPSGMQEMSFIPEADLYRLAFGSKLPTAEKFTDWVVEEVLPTIRQTGSYPAQSAKITSFPEGVTLSSLVGLMRLNRRVMLDLGKGPVEIGKMIVETCQLANFPVVPSLVECLPGQIDLFGRPGLEAAT